MMKLLWGLSTHGLPAKYAPVFHFWTLHLHFFYDFCVDDYLLLLVFFANKVIQQGFKLMKCVAHKC